MVGVLYVDYSPAYVDLAQFPTCNNFISTLFEKGPALLNLSIDAGNWNNGIYLVNLHSDAGSLIQRKVVVMD